MKRKIIRIDEEKCNGCGQCITGCAEGAIQLIEGKARLISETYCDGLGACIGECPVGALTLEEREASDYDQSAVDAHLSASGRKPHAPAPVLWPDRCISLRHQPAAPVRHLPLPSHSPR